MCLGLLQSVHLFTILVYVIKLTKVKINVMSKMNVICFEFIPSWSGMINVSIEYITSPGRAVYRCYVTLI